MTTTSQQVDLWRQSRSEHQRLEFKEAKTQFDFGELCRYDLARKAPRVVYTGSSKADPRLDRSEVKGYAVGFQGLVGFVMAQLPQNEVVEDGLRKEIKLVPEIVIREVVANALIHQDLLLGGPPS